MVPYMHKDKSSADRYQSGQMTRVQGLINLLIVLVHLKMVAILFQFLNHVHQIEVDNFVVELIWVNHVLTIHHIYDVQMLDYFQVVHH